MMRLLRWVLLIVLLVLGAVLLEAHLEIRSVAPPIPTRAELEPLRTTPDGPVRLRYVNTASQRENRSRKRAISTRR